MVGKRTKRGDVLKGEKGERRGQVQGRREEKMKGEAIDEEERGEGRRK